MVRSFYDVLQVERCATLDEIKLAFKKRALHVHPDKGGSKEAFHLVYHAFETLADPEARRKYDCRAATGSQAACHTSSGHQNKAAKRSQPSDTTKAPKAKLCEFQQAKLLSRIHDLLRDLPRDVRNAVIKQNFSPKQRLILEKWMVDTKDPSTESAPQRPRATEDMVSKGDPLTASLALSLVGISNLRPKVSKMALARKKSKRNKTLPKKKRHRRTGCIQESISFGRCVGYLTKIIFDGMDIRTGQCSDLQTAVDWVVILTSVKQKMQDPTTSSSCFEERLRGALMESTAEHGRDVAALNLRFAVHQSAGFFLGPHNFVRSPTVHTIEDLGKLRSFLDPFRQYSRLIGGASMFWWYSPEHLQDAWQNFQMAVQGAWAAAGVDSTEVLRRFCARYDGTSSSRGRHLRNWEREHMALQDKLKHRPKKLRYNYIPPNQRRSCDSGDPVHAVKKPLVTWKLLLEKKAQRAEKERRKAVRKQIKARQERLSELKRMRDRGEKVFSQHQAAFQESRKFDLTGSKWRSNDSSMIVVVDAYIRMLNMISTCLHASELPLPHSFYPLCLQMLGWHLVWPLYDGADGLIAVH